MNLRNMRPSQISHIHRAIGYSLDNSISGLEIENIMLKEKIKELEATLMPLPMFATPLAMIWPTTPGGKVKSIRNPSHISPRLCGKKYKQKNGINNRGLGDVKEYCLFWNKSACFS